MSISKHLENYWEGMKAYDKCHPPTINSQWEAFYGELREFMETPTLEKHGIFYIQVEDYFGS